MADYKGLNIRFRGDPSEASKALNILSNQARNAQGNLTGTQNALKNAETNGKALNDALKRMQLEQVGKQAEAVRGKVDAYGKSLVELQKNLANAQGKLAENKAELSGMPEKYEALANAAASSFDRVAQAQAALDDARQRMEYAGTNSSWLQALQDQSEAQGELNAAIAQGDEAFNQLSATYGTIEGAINSAEEAERKYSAAIDSTKEKILGAESSAKALESQYQSMSTSLAASETKWYQMGESVVSFGSNLKGIGSSIASIGDKLTIVSTAVAATFGRKIISSTEEFGNAISQLGGYLDIQGAQLDEMSDQALKWGKDTQFSATEAAQAMNELAKGGMTQAQISGGAMKATMELAAAGGLDMASSAEVAVQAIKTFGLEAQDASAIADALAGAANKSTAEVTDLANGFKYVGGWASMAGWNINDVSGALALLSDHGLRGEMAGTALRNVMQRLAAPTDTAAKLMNAYGFSVRDSEGHMVSATEVVRRLNDTFGDLNDAEKQNVLNDIFGARALPAAIALMDEGADSLQSYIDATTEAGYAGEMANNRMGELGWALEFLRGEAETAAVNFGTALTPTIKGVAEAIEDALEWFNSLSDAQQTQIANFALMAVAAGPVLSVVGHLMEGFGSLFVTLGNGTQNVMKFVTALNDGKTVAEATNLACAGLTEKLTTLATGAVVTLGMALATDLIARFVEYMDHAELVRQATVGIKEAMNSASEAASNMASEVDGGALSGLADAASESTQALQEAADYAKEIGDKLGSINVESSELDEYASTIEELADKGNLTAEELTLLKDAVSKFNDITGAAIRVTDEQTGKLNLMPSAIRNVAAAYTEFSKAKAYSDLLAEATKKQAQVEYELGEATKKADQIQREHSIVLGDTGYEISTLVWKELDEYRRLSENADALEQSNDSLIQSMQHWKQMLAETGDAAQAYETILESLGIKAKNTAKDLGGLDASDGGYSYDPTTISSGIDDAAKEAQKAQKKANEAIIKEQQRANQRALKDQQKAFDAEYKALQKALDAEYKAQQKANDAEYDAEKKARDKSYDELKKQLDKAYQAQRDANSKQVSEAKSANSKMEKELKASLDRQYKQRKAEIDKEYKQYQKANDKILKDAKSAYSAQTKAFKEETKKRIAEIKAEYAARKQNVADNDGTSEIDSRIKQLQDETKAEQAAIEATAQAEKRAELEKAVEQAKTRRSRADAEKALNDYLAELAQEAREQEREAEIDRLEEQKDLIKEQTSAKKDALDEERDQKIAAYEEQREIELSNLTQTQDQLYDQLKEKLDEQEELRKEKNDETLESYRALLDAQLEALKEQHELEIEQLTEKLAGELEVTKEANEERLEAQKEADEAFLESMKEAHTEQLESMKEAQSEQLESLKESQNDQLDAMREAQQDALDALRDALDEAVDAMDAGGSQMANVGGTKAKETTANVDEGLKDMPTKGAKKASELTDLVKQKLEPMPKDAQKTSKSATDNIVTALLLASNPVGSAAYGLYQAATQGIAALTGSFGDTGNRSGNALSVNIGAAASSVYGNASRLRSSAENGVSGIEGTLGSRGSGGSHAFARGIGAASDDAWNASKSIANDVDENLRSVQDWSHRSGLDAGLNFARGIWDSAQNAINAALSIANAVSEILRHSIAKKGPFHEGGRGEAAWGEHLIENFADGMRSKESMLAMRSRHMAEIVEKEFAPDMSTNYATGYDAKPMAQLFANGVNEALRGGIPQQRGVTVVVNEMNVRKESDIERVSVRLNALRENAERRGW